MRERTKREILELLDTVNEALCHLQAARTADSLLSDCRAAIAAIGRSLAEDGDAHALLSRKLQRFAAALAKAAQQGAALKQAEILALAEELHRLRRKVAGMRARLEIVFLPYKASMWDSLESIWRAAAADPDCDAYVVPIPYYDLHPDHTAAKFHYEGGLYPADVPITDYRAYDLATRRPDVIYIHNPYDGCNRVTSVDPAYYSERLKQYTDMLVYVPYFVVAGDKISEHFCQTPGVYHADRVIVQSEAIKKTYAKFIPAEKILALGSPKFDKVAWMMKHPPAMPKEWAEIARGRKLVLYNTHLSPLIVDDGSVCRKLRYVFSVFEGREDVCLLWRPHPLSEAAMQSMNPKPLAEYLQLVETFKQKKLGIFDDSPDVHRAIALSDAYYGDASSLVALYESTGKPVMLQNLEITEEMKNNHMELSFSSGVVEGDTMWFSNDILNGLFQMDIRTGEIIFLGAFPTTTFQRWPYSKIVKFENKLFLVPSMTCEIAEFDLDTKQFVLYPIHKHGFLGRFRTGFLLDDSIYMIPDVGDSILQFHVKTHKIQYHTKWYASLSSYVQDENKSIFPDAVRVGDNVWCPFRQSNRIVKLDLKTLRCDTYEVGDKENRYFSIAYGEQKFWLVTNSGDKIVRWSEKNGMEGCIDVLENNKVGFCICENETIWFLPKTEGNILEINIKTKRTKYISSPEEIYYKKNSVSKSMYNNMTYNMAQWRTFLLLHRYGNGFFLLNKENGDFKIIKPILKDHDLGKLLEDKKMVEGFISLNLYMRRININYIKLFDKQLLLQRKTGKEIHSYCKIEQIKYCKK